ncbi:MAG: tRNA pseudouridine(13) synthase TruD [Candidatus Nanoarchaeia archaeon]|nr:tRNA pseudouridine(13) synthase TruD [Candidatus Nanoarchaeia archaeon]
MYIIKQQPEDFYVEEIPDFKELKKSGEYAYFLLWKKNWNTMDVIKELARRGKISEKNFNVAGLKDKNAETKQYFSVRGVKKDKIERVLIKDTKIKFVGYGNERLRLGQLRGNIFKIIVRNLDKKLGKVNFMENYFDDQRFSGRNHLLGQSLVKKRFSEFCNMLRLEVKGKDYVSEIRKIGSKKLRFYVNAYQSYLFNKALYSHLGKKYENYKTIENFSGDMIVSNNKVENIKVPVVGFLTELKGEIGEIYKGLLSEEGIKEEDFLIKELPEASSEGNERNLLIKVNNLRLKQIDDKTAEVNFELPPGSYGTLVIKKMYALGV